MASRNKNKHKKTVKIEKNNKPTTHAAKTGAQPKSSKGIYTEYLDQNLTPDQLNSERKVQLKRISEFRDGRDVLVFAADFKKGQIAPIFINPVDLTPINDQISVLSGNKLDFIIETQGGLGEAAEDIVKLLRNKYEEINIIVPGVAKSAGTIIAMAGDDILMEPASALGPIDAQISYQGKQFSAEAFIKGLDDIKDEVTKRGELNKAYIPILQAVSPGEIRSAQNAMEFAQVLVREWLVKYKFKNWTHRKRDGAPITAAQRAARANEIASKLSNHSLWLTHGRSLKIDDLRDMELMITDYSEIPDLADAIRRYKILLQLTFDTTNIYKIYETPKSQIISQVNVPVITPVQGTPLPIPAQDVKSLDVDFKCNACQYVTKIQARFTKAEPLKSGFMNFPPSNKFRCKGCQVEHDINGVRQNIERQFGKKIVS